MKTKIFLKKILPSISGKAKDGPSNPRSLTISVGKIIIIL